MQAPSVPATMRITLHYHSFLKDATRCAAETFDLPAGATMLDVLRAVAARHPAAQSVLLLRSGDIAPYVKLWRNGQPLTPEAAADALADGDTLALYPALSGG